MRNHLRTVALSASVVIITSVMSFTNLAYSEDKKTTEANSKVIEEGKAIAFDRGKGNCLACHRMADGEAPGNIGPPLIAMQARFPDKAVLRSQIYDSRKKNIDTIMPPFGAHAILTDDEIDKVVEFIHTL